MSPLAAEDLAAPVRKEMEATEKELVRLLDAESESLRPLSDHLARYGGKRIRPALVHLSAYLISKPNAEHVIIAAMVEAIHMASLLHDDVLDGADTRRKSMTLNALHGNQVPILLGDFVYSKAFARSLDLENSEAGRVLAEASQALCRGEIEQSLFKERRIFDEDAYFMVIDLKTASLFEASLYLGARYAGGNAEQVAALSDYGRKLGMAFQIIDDCLDVVGDERVVGKSLGTDLETGKLTLPVIRLARSLPPERVERLREVLFGEVNGSRRECLTMEFDLDEAVASARYEAKALALEARELIQQFPDVPARHSLGGLCEFVIARSH